MKRLAIPVNLQLNLPLPDAPAATLPGNQQRELTLALVELLLSAARASAVHPAPGGGNESEVDD